MTLQSSPQISKLALNYGNPFIYFSIIFYKSHYFHKQPIKIQNLLLVNAVATLQNKASANLRLGYLRNQLADQEGLSWRCSCQLDFNVAQSNNNNAACRHSKSNNMYKHCRTFRMPSQGRRQEDLENGCSLGYVMQLPSILLSCKCNLCVSPHSLLSPIPPSISLSLSTSL